MAAVNVVFLASALLVFQVVTSEYGYEYNYDPNIHKSCFDDNDYAYERAVKGGKPVHPKAVMNESILNMCSSNFDFAQECDGPVYLKAESKKENGKYITVNAKFTCCSKERKSSFTFGDGYEICAIENNNEYWIDTIYSYPPENCFLAIGKNCRTKAYRVASFFPKVCPSDCYMRCYGYGRDVATALGIKNFMPLRTPEFDECKNNNNY